MVTFTASRGVNVNSLVGLGELANFLDATLKNESANGFTADFGRVDFVFSGDFNVFPILTGTIESATVKLDGVTQYKIAGLDLDLSNVDDLADIPAIMSGRDTLKGSNQKDTLRGFGGNDKVSGNGGDDKLQGDSGRDTLIGGIGKDTMKGGADRDTFVFNATAESVFGSNRDVISDFKESDGDRIDLRPIDAKVGGADDPFTFIGAEGFSAYLAAHPGFNGGMVRVSGGIVQVNVAGHGGVEMEIQAAGATAIGDFLL